MDFLHTICYQIFSSSCEEQVLFMMCTNAQQYRPTCHVQTHTCASQTPKSHTTRTTHSQAPASDDVQMDERKVATIEPGVRGG